MWLKGFFNDDAFPGDMFQAFAACQYGDIDAVIVQVSGANGAVNSRADHEDSDVVVVIFHGLVEGSLRAAPPPNQPIATAALAPSSER